VNKKDLCLARWALALKEHRPGKNMYYVDALICYPIAHIIERQKELITLLNRLLYIL